jgi:hypothetical protein
MKARFWGSSRTVPVVIRKITASKRFRLRNLNWPASSVASTEKSLASPSPRIAAIPSGIERCRNPAVFEKTRTSNSGSPPLRRSVSAPAGAPSAAPRAARTTVAAAAKARRGTLMP